MMSVQPGDNTKHIFCKGLGTFPESGLLRHKTEHSAYLFYLKGPQVRKVGNHKTTQSGYGKPIWSKIEE